MPDRSKSMRSIEESLMKFWPAGLRRLVLVISVAMLATATLAQGPTARLQVAIMDPTGAVVPEAALTLKNSSGLALASKSNGLGEYEFRNLAPGKYTLTVNATGFIPSTQEVEVAAGQLTKADVTLKVQAKEQNIEVQSDAARVSTSSDSNASSVVISGKDLDALSDDPDELQSELQALAGPSAGPNGGQIYIDGFTRGRRAEEATS